jgi:hypothetical protein
MFPVSFDVGGFINGLIKTHKLNEWGKSLLGLCVTWMISASTGMGTALVAGKSLLFAAGAGLLAGAGGVLAQIMRDPRLKGITFTFPQQVASSDQQSQFESEKT